MPVIALMAGILALAACNADDGDTGGADGGATDGGAADGGTADGGADTGSTDGGADDTGGTRTGASYRIGTATVTAEGYAGTEDWLFLADGSDGAQICLIRTTLTSTAPRDDCEECDWAWELVVSDATVVADNAPGCLAVAGYDADTVSQLDGTTVAYGYSPDYFGHAEVLMGVVDGAWTALAFASWDEATGSFNYEREAGYFDY